MDELDDEYGFFEDECSGCDCIKLLNDLGLCDSCNDKLNRDLIRQRDWDYSALAFGVPSSKREYLRKVIIKEYGETFELIAPPKENKKNKTKKRKRKNKQQKAC